jgi:Na+-translocating ferredoxin:NAD+ oxidoreductase RnfD subunit
MGQLSTADDDRVDVGLADHLAGKAVAHLYDLCDSVRTLGLYTQLDHGHPFLAEVAPITGPMYQLFIFFMITDPKTTVQTTWGQCVVAFLVALVEMLLRLNESVYAPLYALFLVGPTANLIEIWWNSRWSATASAPLSFPKT